MLHLRPDTVTETKSVFSHIDLFLGVPLFISLSYVEAWCSGHEHGSSGGGGPTQYKSKCKEQQ